MKKYLRVPALALCIVLMLSIFTGCNGETAESAEKSSAASVTAGVDEQKTPVTAEPVASEAEDSAEPETTESVLPLCQETQTISYWFEMSPMVAGYLETMNDNITWQYIEELTNVHVDFRAVSDETSENFNLMIASGDWADIMVWGGNYYSGGAMKAVEDGVFMELTDVIADYMPNYGRLIDDKDIYPQVVMDDGRIGEIFTINRGVSDPGTGPIARKDWLDKLNIDPASVQTYEDYHVCLLPLRPNLVRHRHCIWDLSACRTAIIWQRAMGLRLIATRPVMRDPITRMTVL